jgi:predicted MFS family arabinose efflux permease
MPRRLVLALVALAGAGIAMAWPLALADPVWSVAVAAALGAMVLAYYSVGLALLGQRFGLDDLAVANAAFIACYEIGTVSGPTLAGAAMDLWDPHGLPATLAVVSLAFAVLALVRWRSGTDERRAESVLD